jgi:hypothetical protein
LFYSGGNNCIGTELREGQHNEIIVFEMIVVRAKCFGEALEEHASCKMVDHSLYYDTNFSTRDLFKARSLYILFKYHILNHDVSNLSDDMDHTFVS